MYEDKWVNNMIDLGNKVVIGYCTRANTRFAPTLVLEHWLILGFYLMAKIRFVHPRTKTEIKPMSENDCRGKPCVCPLTITGIKLMTQKKWVTKDDI